MDSDKILREVGVRYKAIKNQDITKDAVIWYHEEDVKKAIDLALTITDVVASLPTKEEIEIEVKRQAKFKNIFGDIRYSEDRTKGFMNCVNWYTEKINK
jgi:hypothetical protein